MGFYSGFYQCLYQVRCFLPDLVSTDTLFRPLFSKKVRDQVSRMVKDIEIILDLLKEWDRIIYILCIDPEVVSLRSDK